jgi:aminopeptidase N
MTEAMIDKTEQHPHATIYLSAYQPPAFLIDSLNLQIELYDGYAQVTSRLRMQRQGGLQSATESLILLGEQLTLNCIQLNGKALTTQDYTVNETSLTIHAVPEQFELEIQTICVPEKNTALSGLYKSANAYCTQCEAEGFRRITYYLDRPDVLTRFTTTISADKIRYPYLLSNGNLIATGDLENGRHFAMWEDPFKKPCYLFALVAGDFDVVEDTFITQSGKSIALKFYVEKGEGEKALHAVYSLKQAMRWDEEAYGREYDLAIYMVVAVSDFNMGAMENKGLNIFNTKYIFAKPESATDDDYIHVLSVVGHEYFHNWTGNRITCRDWFQLSLKEGLTVFREQTFTEDTLSAPVMRIQEVNVLREAQFPEDAGPLAHPVRPDSYIEINNFYTATIYNKGAEVLRMLQTILGKDLFRLGMDLYFERHDGEAVTIEDYVKVMEDVSGLDLTQFKRWYTEAGTPVVNAVGHYDESKATYTLTLTQTLKTPFHIPIRFGLVGKDGKAIALQSNQEVPVTETVLHLTQPEQVFQFNNVKQTPTPSLLRHFSAPIKLHYSYSDAELLHLSKYDADPFNRWEAGQKLMLNCMLQLINDVQQGKTSLEKLTLPANVLEAFQHLLQQESHDKFFQAEMLLLPSEKYLGEHMPIIDVDVIYAVRQFVASTLAKTHEALLLKLYQDNQTPSQHYQFNMEEIGKRQLKNRCLGYLLLAPQNIDIGIQQFKRSLNSNMTDTLAALSGIANLNVPECAMALSAFYEAWQHDALVIDKWFAIQAVSKLPNTLENVKQLMQHPAFDIKNPNKVYALIGSFGRRNALRFHAADGSGYVFLREIVQQLDILNPQISSRMVEPLTSWKRYDKERQTLMRNQLERLRQDKKLSTDLFELVTKSLENK